MEQITAIVTCFNEENRISTVLDSLKEFDEVIVIDKSSTDKTVEIVKQYDCKLYEIEYYDNLSEEGIAESLAEIYSSSRNEWIMGVVCSDVIHPQLYSEMIELINNGDYEMVNVPIYRYSMGFTSKYSFYEDIQYQSKLFKRNLVDFKMLDIHSSRIKYTVKCATLYPKDKRIAIYHLTHENLELVLERHLRYARIEAETARIQEDKQECLRKSWRSVLRVVKNYIKLRTYKLGDKGKAQLCMLLLYRCANYLNIYLDSEEEAKIKEIYDQIRKKRTIE